MSCYLFYKKEKVLFSKSRSNHSRMKNIIYLTRTGLLEPLGQSQVLNYLFGLSNDFSITVISNERSGDLKNVDRLLSLQNKCKKYNIKWYPQEYLNKPRFIAQIFNILKMTFISLRKIQNEKVDIIHARSYIPAFVAWLLNFFTSVPFIFDMRGLWPEELITAKRIKRNSISHKILKKLEAILIRDAATVVSLTNAAVLYLKKKYPHELTHQKIIVIPTCADLDHFKILHNINNNNSTYGCIGSITSGWFNTELFTRFISYVFHQDPNQRLEIVTRDNSTDVMRIIDPNNIFKDKLNIKSSEFEDMPMILNSHILSIMFYAGGEISELGRSPTRMAEVLGCGLPIIANDGVGDVASIVQKNNVGVIVKGSSKLAFKKALEDLNILLADPYLSTRCRHTAESIFSLKAGTEAYSKIYFSILQKGI